MSSSPNEHLLEPKFGWGHEEALRNQKEAIAVQVEQLEVDSSWRPNEVIRYVARLIRNL
jgi:predicted RNase H-like HicB family nuclease